MSYYDVHTYQPFVITPYYMMTGMSNVISTYEIGQNKKFARLRSIYLVQSGEAKNAFYM
jgi:hypothetical protein